MKEDIPAEWSSPRTTSLRANQLCPRLSCWDFFKRLWLEVPEAAAPAPRLCTSNSLTSIKDGFGIGLQWQSGLSGLHRQNFLLDPFVFKTFTLAFYLLTRDYAFTVAQVNTKWIASCKCLYTVIATMSLLNLLISKPKNSLIQTLMELNGKSQKVQTKIYI